MFILGSVCLLLDTLFWCSVSCFMWSSALDSSDVLLSYPMTPLASHITNLHTYTYPQTSNIYTCLSREIQPLICLMDNSWQNKSKKLAMGQRKSTLIFEYGNMGIHCQGLIRKMQGLCCMLYVQRGLLLYTAAVKFHIQWCTRKP